MNVSGSGYEPEGLVTMAGKDASFATVKSKTIRELAMICSLCNDARISYDQASL